MAAASRSSIRARQELFLRILETKSQGLPEYVLPLVRVDGVLCRVLAGPSLIFHVELYVLWFLFLPWNLFFGLAHSSSSRRRL